MPILLNIPGPPTAEGKDSLLYLRMREAVSSYTKVVADDNYTISIDIDDNENIVGVGISS